MIWDRLAAEWEISVQERAYIDRQQGTACRSCGGTLRSVALARAVLAWARSPLTLVEFVRTRAARRLRVLELNEAGSLGRILERLPRRVLGEYPEVDMQKLPYAAGAFDLVIHSDTLEHVPDPAAALRECLRVLRPGGAMCFTVPIIVGRLTRPRAGLPPSYHGRPPEPGQSSVEQTLGMAVQTEYGADVWTELFAAGFGSVEIVSAEYPSAQAFIARRDSGKRPRGRLLSKLQAVPQRVAQLALRTSQ